VEDRFGKIRPGEVRSLEVRFDKVCPAEVRFSKVRPDQDRPGRVRENTGLISRRIRALPEKRWDEAWPGEIEDARDPRAARSLYRQALALPGLVRAHQPRITCEDGCKLRAPLNAQADLACRARMSLARLKRPAG
jgi:hypothetical protein